MLQSALLLLVSYSMINDLTSITRYSAICNYCNKQRSYYSGVV